jgi:DNA-binding transcriptional MerR regulator/methylmalonyl-CoA mutase cobalamin-binding subunit
MWAAMTAMTDHEAAFTMMSIAQVERETNLSKDVLRVWERRYGFPVPERDGKGERLYSHEVVVRLRRIKRLIDQGHRPGKLLSMSALELEKLGPGHESGEQVLDLPDNLKPVMDCLREHDLHGLRAHLQQILARLGMQRFVTEAMPLLNIAVGQAWARGQIAIHQEHLYSEEIHRALRQALASVPSARQPPRVLLTTLPGEEHALGLLMVEAFLAPEGVDCLSLGVQTPIDEIVAAAVSHEADAVVLSFSVVFSLSAARDGLVVLRHRLPIGIELWVGGGLSLKMKSLDETIRLTPRLEDALEAVERWRLRHLV